MRGYTTIPASRDLVGMAAAQVTGAAKLGDLEVALGLPAINPVAEHDQPVDHGLLGRNLAAVIGRQEHRAIGRKGNLLEVVDEHPERLLVGGTRGSGDESVDHQHRDPAPLDLATQELGELGQTALLHLAEGAQIGERFADPGLVEE